MRLTRGNVVRLSIIIVMSVGVGAAFSQTTAPIVNSISPSSGPIGGGTAVTITGSNFQVGATVTFGSVAAVGVSVISPTTITATTPANSAGPMNVIVTNPDAQSGTLYAVQQPLSNPGFESGGTGWTATTSGTATVVNDHAGAHGGNNHAQLSVSAPNTSISYIAQLNGSSAYLPVNPGDVISFGGWAFRVDTNTGDGMARWQIELTDSNKANASYVVTTPNNVTTATWTQQQKSYTVPAGKSFLRFWCQISGNSAQAQANFDDANLSRSVPGGGFTYVGPPSLQSITPTSGPVSGGTAVTLTGSNFQAGATVKFGASPATAVSVVNSTTVTASTPSGSMGQVNVTVTNPDSQSSSLTNGFTYTAVQAPPPTISGISPASGSTNGGTSVSISGANFVSGAKVSFASLAATNVNVASSTSITATTPSTSTAGAVNVTVINPDSQSATLYANQQPLTNPGFESGNAGWTATGSGTAVVLNNPSGAHSGANYGQLTAPPPNKWVNFVAALSGSSQYLPVNPGDGITFGGWAYRVDTNTGDGLARWQIEFTDSNKLNPTYVTAVPNNVTGATWVQQQKTYTVPAGEAFVRFWCQITGVNGTVQAQANCDDATFIRTIPGGGFTYVAAPTLASITPSAGSVKGGTSVTLQGLNFESGATVTFGSVAATNIVVTSSATITALTPANPAGKVDVRVVNPDGQGSVLPQGYTYNPAPAITSIAPSSGTTAGGTSVTITGTNFLTNATVTFGGVAAPSVTVVAPNQIAATTPSHSSGSVNVVVTNPDGQSATLSNGYNFAGAAPSISSIAPTSGTSTGGTLVNIHGSNFQVGATVTIGGSQVSVTSVQSTLIKGTTTAHVAGGADIVVTNPDTQKATFSATLYNQGFESGSSRWAFAGTGTGTIVNNVNNAHNGTYYAELSSPTSGKQPSLYVADASNKSLYFPVVPGDVITFGGWAYRVSGDGSARWGIEATDSNKANPTFIAAPPSNIQEALWELQQGTYTVPSGKSFIRLSCQITGNTVAAVARFDDALLHRSPEGSDGYSYVSPPWINAIAPNWGALAGGTTRTVSGTGFQNGSTVTVGGVPATQVVVNNANAITFFVPPNNAGTADVVVTGPTPDFQTSNTLSGGYTYKVPPSPSAGMTAIHHIIYTVQENRSFDQYFGLMNQYRANNGVNDNAVDGLPLNVALPDIANQMILPFHLQTECEENTQPSWNAQHIDYDGGKMDNFMKTGNMFTTSSTIDPNGTRAIGYYDWTDLSYYYSLAFQFATSDRWFASMLGPTGANRAYLAAGTSLGYIATPVPPSGGFPNMTIFDLLDQGGVSWRYYYQDSSPAWIPIWSVYFKDTGNFVPISNYYTDVQTENTFPQVVFIEENGNLDEHPKPNPGAGGSGQSIQAGANLISGMINALLRSPSWSSSVFILTYDEAGGMHDHVAPVTNQPAPDGYPPVKQPAVDQPGTFNQFGMRVPLVVVSPWTVPHLVSHTVRDHTSILKLIETRFSLPPLTARDAAADNMMEFFNFSSPAWTTPPAACSGTNTTACLVPQPTNGVCNLNLEKAPGQ